MKAQSSFAFVLVCLSAGCGSDESRHPKPVGGPEVRFEIGDEGPRFLDLPFPSDAYLEADGTLMDCLPGFTDYVTSNADYLEATLARQNGFGVNSGATFRVFDGAELDAEGNRVAPVIDQGSLPASESACLSASSSVLFVDLDAASPSEARVPCRAGFHDDRQAGSQQVPVLAVLPARGVVLAESRRYAVVVTDRVTAGGKPVKASATFAAIRDGARRATDLEKLYGGAVDRVRELVILPNDTEMSALTVFTTQNTGAELVAMREQVAEAVTPTLNWDPDAILPMFRGLFAHSAVSGFTATFDEWLGAPAKLSDGSDDPARDQQEGAAHDALAAMGTAVFDAPNFLLDRGDYQNSEHANVARDGNGQPILNSEKPTSKVWVTLALPKGPMPAAGFPVVIVQHGLQGDRSFLLALANTLAQQGWASVAIDAPTFGARATSPNDTKDDVSNFPWSARATYGGPDGFVDKAASAISFFGGFTNFGAVRDQLREAVVDLGTLAEVVSDPNLDLGPLLQAVPGAKFDSSHIGYIGDSFGSIVGLMVAAVDPKISAFVLNVGGGGILTEVVSNGPAIASIVAPAAGVVYGIGLDDHLNETHPFVGLLQGMIDAADPLLHARRIVLEPATLGSKKNRPKNVILIEALWDELVSNEGSEAMARAAGFALASPNVGPNAGVDLPTVEPSGGGIRNTPKAGVTAVLVQASPATHGSDFYNASGVRKYAIPYGQPGDDPFPILRDEIPVREPYLGLQKMAVGFFRSAFAGEVPVVRDIPKPVRDFDDDGRDDAKDADPLDPTK